MRRRLYWSGSAARQQPGQFYWWTPSSPINQPIKSNPALDPQSSSIMAAIAAGSSWALAVADYGVPIYFAESSTPRWNIVPSRTGDWGDGTNPFQNYPSIPIDMNWTTIPSTDGHLSVVDGETIFDFWKMDLSGSSPICEWGGVAHPLTSTITTDPYGTATAAAFSRSAGVIREEEMERGFIDHALVFSSDICRNGEYRFPAIHSDGKNLRGVGQSSTIVQGARIQMDPSLDVDATNWPPYAKIVAKALQTYGAYCIDNGGAAVSISAELPHSAAFTGGVWQTNSTAYNSRGLNENTRSINMLPWSSGFRVLNTWDGV